MATIPSFEISYNPNKSPTAGLLPRQLKAQGLYDLHLLLQADGETALDVSAPVRVGEAKPRTHFESVPGLRKLVSYIEIPRLVRIPFLFLDDKLEPAKGPITWNFMYDGHISPGDPQPYLDLNKDSRRVQGPVVDAYFVQRQSPGIRLFPETAQIPGE